MLPKSTLAVVLVVLSISQACIAQPPDKAAELYNSGDYAGALLLMKARLKQNPSGHNNRYMVAQTLFLLGEYEDALREWLEVERATKDTDLTLKEKLIQTYEQLDNAEEVEARVKALLDLRAKTEDDEYKNKKFFCRDQFSVDNVKFMSFHYFDFPKVETCYAIFRLDEEGEVASKFKFWSCKETNIVAKALDDMTEDQRLYHIDEYVDRDKYNYLHTKQKLTYRQFKDRVLEKMKKGEARFSDANASTIINRSN